MINILIVLCKIVEYVGRRIVPSEYRVIFVKHPMQNTIATHDFKNKINNSVSFICSSVLFIKISLEMFVQR